MEKRKILQINVTANSGSTGRIAESIGKRILQEGWCSYIAYGRMGRPSSSELIKIGNKLDVNTHVILSRFFDMQGLGSINATKLLIDRIKIIKPDLIHLHNIHGYYLNYPLLFSYLQRLNTPIVWTLHDCWPFTGHCAYFDSIGCNRWQTSCFNCPGKLLYPKSFLDRSRRNFDLKKELFQSISGRLTIVTVSHWLESLVRKSFLNNAHIVTIHNGIDLSVFRPIEASCKTKYGINSPKIVLGVASPWSERKGLRDFIELRGRLDSSYSIVLVGLNNKQVSSLPPGIVGICRTESAQELAELYSMANVFVNPTYEDNYPTTNLESIACGTPVITYQTGGSPEAINNSTGLIVPQGNLLELQNSIESVCSISRNSWRNACRKYAEDFFDSELIYHSYISLYRSLLN